MRLPKRIPSGEDQREQDEPLLTLRGKPARVAAADLEPVIVAVRAVAGVSAIQIGREALGELGRELLHTRRA